jgi:Na+/proline symporter
VGLFGFALWSLIQALFDTERQGHDAKGIAARVGYACVAISYGLLGLAAYQIASTGSPSASSRNSTSSAQNWTGLLLKQPAGILLVILLGAVVLCIAFYMFHRAYHATFAKHLDLSRLNKQARAGVIRTGRFGYAAIGIVFTIIGFFLVIAGAQHNPGDAKGLDSALMELLKQPFGPWLLGIVALGLVARGAYSLVEARYRKVGG